MPGPSDEEVRLGREQLRASEQFREAEAAAASASVTTLAAVKEPEAEGSKGLMGLGELWVGGNSPGCAEGAVKEEVVDIADCCPLPTEELNRENLSIDDLQNFTTQLPPEAINREIVYVVEKRGSAYTPEERMTIIDAQDHAAMPLFRKQWRP